MSTRTVVSLIAAGANGRGAVASRVTGIADGLRRRGWSSDIRDVALPGLSLTQRMLDRTPAHIRERLERFGVEGDILPITGWHTRAHLKELDADAAIVLVPPFSLLATAALTVPNRLPLIVDYGDPWSARIAPPPLAWLTRFVERRAARRFDAVSYAGGPRLAKLLADTLHINHGKVVAVPNAHDRQNITGLAPHHPRTERNGTPLDLMFGGYWYGRNGPGILVDVLADVGPRIAQLTVIGGVAPSIEADLRRTVGGNFRVVPPMSCPQLYRQLAHADVAIVPLDPSSAVESRIPAKVYDSLAVGTPLIALCPADAALLTVPGAERIHYVDYRDAEGLADLLAAAANDRSVLRSGPLGEGPTHDAGVDGLDRLLRRVCAQPR